jgi:hypothetical protein
VEFSEKPDVNLSHTVRVNFLSEKAPQSVTRPGKQFRIDGGKHAGSEGRGGVKPAVYSDETKYSRTRKSSVYDGRRGWISKTALIGH